MRLVTMLVMAATNALMSVFGALALGFHHFCTWLLRAFKSAWSFHKCQELFGKSKRQTPHSPTVKDIPGPWPLPVLGTRWLFSPIIGRYKLSQAHLAYHDMFERYGDIIKEEAVFNIPVVSTRNVNDIELVYKSNPKYPIRPPDIVSDLYRSTRPDRYKGPGLVNVQGEEWHRLRKLITPELTSSSMMHDFLPELNMVVDDLISLIVELRDPETDLLPNYLHVGLQLGMESTCVLMLGQRIGFLEREINPFAAKLRDALREHFQACSDGFYGLPLWKWFPTATYRKMMRSEEALYDIISELVDPAIKQIDDTCQVEPIGSVLMNVLRRPELDIREKKSAIVDFIAAGIHTVGNSTAMLLHLVATHPQAQDRLYKEISSLIGISEPLTVRHLQSATYLKACVQESYRCVSTASMLARIISEDMKLSGYHVPAGTVVLCHLTEACGDERHFVRPKEFLPERWIPQEAAKLGLTPKYPFLVSPFGFNRRMCPGKKFAELELYLLLAKIIRRFEISCTVPLNLYFEFLLSPHGEMPIVFRDR